MTVNDQLNYKVQSDLDSKTQHKLDGVNAIGSMGRSQHALYPLGSMEKIFHRENLNFQTETTTMKRMFSKKGLVESSKEEHIEDVESDADLQE